MVYKHIYTYIPHIQKNRNVEPSLGLASRIPHGQEAMKKKIAELEGNIKKQEAGQFFKRCFESLRICSASILNLFAGRDSDSGGGI